eukprot:scaffold2908_cov257-Pinguiococcus_pyrenoidosus.AAC.11
MAVPDHRHLLADLDAFRVLVPPRTELSLRVADLLDPGDLVRGRVCPATEALLSAQDDKLLLRVDPIDDVDLVEGHAPIELVSGREHAGGLHVAQKIIEKNKLAALGSMARNLVKEALMNKETRRRDELFTSHFVRDGHDLRPGLVLPELIVDGRRELRHAA